ncbi:hypothetical protein [Streptomyces monomycini]|uniref:hypothetical protein n=1 Tax=Streptomyces monomycini TaxID=371720 RepID=UPI001EEAB65F|nr:hypothetical protein [Streptomyces monomycini]
MLNLSVLLEDSARTHPVRDAVVLGTTRLTYAQAEAGAVVVPLNILLKGREAAYHLAGSEAKAYFCFEGDAGLPMGAEGHAGFSEAPGCEHFFLTSTSKGSRRTCASVSPAVPRSPRSSASRSGSDWASRSWPSAWTWVGRTADDSE